MFLLLMFSLCCCRWYTCCWWFSSRFSVTLWQFVQSPAAWSIWTPSSAADEPQLFWQEVCRLSNEVQSKNTYKSHKSYVFIIIGHKGSPPRSCASLMELSEAQGWHEDCFRFQIVLRWVPLEHAKNLKLKACLLQRGTLRRVCSLGQLP